MEKRQKNKHQMQDPLDVGAKNVKAMVALLGILAKERKLDVRELREQLWPGLPEGWTAQRVQSESMPLGVYNVVQGNFARILGDPSQLEKYGKLGVRVNFGGLTALVDWVRMLLRFSASPEWVFRAVVPRVSIGFNDNKRITCVESSWNHVTHRVVYQNQNNQRTREPEEDIDSLIWWAPGFTAATAWFWRLEAQIVHHVLELDLPWVLRQYLSAGVELQEGNDGCLYVSGKSVAERIRLFRDADGYFTARRSKSSSVDHTADYKEGWVVLTDVTVQAKDGHTWTVVKAGQVFCRQAGCSLTEYNWSPPKWTELIYRVFHRVTQVEWLHTRVAETLGTRVDEAEWEAQVELERARAVAAELERRKADQDNYPTPHLAQLAVTGHLGERNTPCVILFFDVANYTKLMRSIGVIEMVKLLRPFWQECWASTLRYSPWSLQWKRGDAVKWVADQPGDGWLLILSHDFDGDTKIDLEWSKRELVKLALDLAGRFHAAIARISDADGQPMTVRVGITWEPRLVLFQAGHNNRRIQPAADGVNRAARIQDAGKLPGFADPQGATTLLEAELAGVLNHSDWFERAGAPDLKGLGEVELVRCLHQNILI